MELKERFELARMIADQYIDFRDFALDGMLLLGFNLTDIQEDIADFMEHGPRLRMVMAQRGEAKSTLAALYAVWRFIQRPSTRILVVSGGETQASEVATLIIRIIMQWDILEYLRPDKTAGDKTSVEHFDIHWTIRNALDKSPSLACVGITAQLQGKRADLLIADDVETTKNGLTMAMRSHLHHLTKEFSSICISGDILYLGTPQTKDSVYNTLPGRGYEIRIWPGRYPTQEEMEKYGDRLAPLIASRLKANPALAKGGGLDGKRGQPTDPERYDNEALIEKELDQGPEGFQLQYMLDTSLMDAQRQQLKLSDLIVSNFSWELVPEVVAWQSDPRYLVTLGKDFPIPNVRMYYPASCSTVFRKLNDLMMFIDPAGGGADELGFAVSGSLGPYIHLLRVGGLRGGLTDLNGDALCDIILEYRLTHVVVESNMGHGLFEINLRAILARRAVDEPFFHDVGVTGEYSTGQKERRIIDSLVSPMLRHRVIVHPEVFEDDAFYGKQHTPEKRPMYSFFNQLANITTDRQSLAKDDRLEAAAGAVRYHKAVLVQDEDKAARQREEAEVKAWLDDPMGYGPQHTARPGKGSRGLVQQRRKRK